MNLRKIAVAKTLGKVFCMGIQVCLFEGVHLTSSLSRRDGGDGGELLKAVSQTLSSHGAAAAVAAQLIFELKKQIKHYRKLSVGGQYSLQKTVHVS